MLSTASMDAENRGDVLNGDLWYIVSREVSSRGHTKELAALCLVSRRVNAAATPWLYRSIKLDFDPPKNHLSCFVNNKNTQLHLIRNFTMQGDNRSLVEAQLGKLKKVLPELSNIDRFHWKSARPFPVSLMGALQAHPSIKEIVVELCHNVDDREYRFNGRTYKTGLTPGVPRLVSVKRVVDTLTDVHRYSFSGSFFPPSWCALMDIDITSMRVLELDCCTNIGDLFNGLLKEVANVRLVTLSIRRSEPQARIGYAVKESIERFLTAHRGLEEVILTNLGEDRLSLRAILAQGQSLRVLKLLESYVKDSVANDSRQDLVSETDKARIHQACPHLQQLVMD